MGVHIVCNEVVNIKIYTNEVANSRNPDIIRFEPKLLFNNVPMINWRSHVEKALCCKVDFSLRPILGTTLKFNIDFKTSIKHHEDKFHCTLDENVENTLLIDRKYKNANLLCYYDYNVKVTSNFKLHGNEKILVDVKSNWNILSHREIDIAKNVKPEKHTNYHEYTSKQLEFSK